MEMSSHVPYLEEKEGVQETEKYFKRYGSLLAC